MLCLLEGNELSGSGIGASVAAEQYGKDLITLRKVIDELYENSRVKPLLIAPGGFFDEEWYAKLLEVSGPGVVNVMTHHIYNLGAGKLKAPSSVWLEETGRRYTIFPFSFAIRCHISQVLLSYPVRIFLIFFDYREGKMVICENLQLSRTK